MRDRLKQGQRGKGNIVGREWRGWRQKRMLRGDIFSKLQLIHLQETPRCFLEKKV